MLGDLQILNGEGQSFSLQNYGFCIGTYRENKSCCFSNQNVKIKNPALIYFRAWHILHAHVKFFLSEMLPRAPNTK